MTTLLPLTYRRLLSRPAARRALLAGVALRLPGAAMFPTLTLLCVASLGTSYAGAGLASAAYTITAALTAPWIGRAIDQHGVRWAAARVLPVHLLIWLLISHVTYPGVVALAALAGAVGLPFWGISRQLVLHAVTDEDRTTALSLDSVGTELAYIVGPAAGIGLATTWSPRAAITCTGLLIVAGIVSLAVTNPAFHQDAGTPQTHDPHPPSPLRTRGIPALLALSVLVATTLVGTDLLLLAQLRHMHHAGAYAAIAALWAAGSMAGGLLYGVRSTRVPADPLVVLLCLATLPIAFAPGPTTLAVVGFLAGLPCAPVMTAITDDITRLVPPQRRTEALGLYSSAHTTGATLGSTAVGALIDHAGAVAATLILTLGGAAGAAVLALAHGSRSMRDTTIPTSSEEQL